MPIDIACQYKNFKSKQKKTSQLNIQFIFILFFLSNIIFSLHKSFGEQLIFSCMVIAFIMWINIKKIKLFFYFLFFSYSISFLLVWMNGYEGPSLYELPFKSALNLSTIVVLCLSLSHDFINNYNLKSSVNQNGLFYQFISMTIFFIHTVEKQYKALKEVFIVRGLHKKKLKSIPIFFESLILESFEKSFIYLEYHYIKPEVSHIENVKHKPHLCMSVTLLFIEMSLIFLVIKNIIEFNDIYCLLFLLSGAMLSYARIS